MEDHKKSLQAVEDARAALQLDARRAGAAFTAGWRRARLRVLDPSLRASKPITSENKQVVVPVYLTFMIKKLVASRSEADEDGISLVGTLIQRPLLYDLASLPRCSGKTATPYFATRVNEGETSVEGVSMKGKSPLTLPKVYTVVRGEQHPRLLQPIYP